jgi:hypothetical protein
MSQTSQLVSLYESEGWKHFENWLDTQIQNCVVGIMQPETPLDEVEKFRFLAMAYQSIKDKVEADKQNNKEAQK